LGHLEGIPNNIGKIPILFGTSDEKHFGKPNCHKYLLAPLLAKHILWN
jgi:hypothetical protein